MGRIGYALEVFALQAGDHPFPDRHRALVSRGGDHRGVWNAWGCQHGKSHGSLLFRPAARTRTVSAAGKGRRGGDARRRSRGKRRRVRERRTEVGPFAARARV